MPERHKKIIFKTKNSHMCEFLTRKYQNGLALNTIAQFYWSIAIGACLVELAASGLCRHNKRGIVCSRNAWVCNSTSFVDMCVATTLQHQSVINYRYWYGRCLEVVIDHLPAPVYNALNCDSCRHMQKLQECRSLQRTNAPHTFCASRPACM